MAFVEEHFIYRLRSLEREDAVHIEGALVWHSFGGFWVRRLSKGPALAYWRLLVEREVIFWRIPFSLSVALGRIA